MRTSLKDIAERLNLSKTTVSWTLSGQGDKRNISRETQEKILQCAKDMHYQPNFMAQGLNTGQTGIIGLIIPDITDSFYSSIARQMEMEAEEMGYSLMICNSEASQEREDRLLTTFHNKQIDGIIIASVERSDDKIKELFDEDFPIVTFDRLLSGTSYNSIMINNIEASRHVISGMIRRGAKKIAFITTNTHLQEMEDRCKGYEKAIIDAGMKFNKDLVGDVDFEDREEDIFDVLDRIYHQFPDVDGFFFATHVLAIEAFRYFHERGIDISSGYQLGSIQSEKSFRAIAPRMRIAQMPVEEISREAVRMVLECIQCYHKKEERPQEHIVLDCNYTKV